MFALFLDRDGVINHEVNFLRRIEDLEFLPRSIEALSRFSETFDSSDCKIIIVTNQSMIARGMCSAEDFEKLSGQYLEELTQQSDGRARIDDVLYCPHHPTKGIEPYRVQCECRKPATGMFLESQRRYDLDLTSSYMVGDRATDILGGQAAGCFGIMVRTGYAGDDGSGIESAPDAWTEDLYGATDLIIQRVRL
jgi:D,D-heptose 1,7-bisphosphate phosphatase